MKVCLFITQLEFGGAQKALCVLAQGLQAKGCEVKLYCFYDKNNFATSFEERFGIKFTVLIDDYRGSKLKKFKKTLGGIVALFKALKVEKFDLVQTFTHYSNIIVPVISRLSSRKTKVITSQRASIPPLGKHVVFLDRLIQNSFFVDKMTCVSRSICESCVLEEKIYPHKLVVIPNGISTSTVKLSRDELRHELSIDNEAIVFITVARFHEQKGYEYLVNAIKKVHENRLLNYVFVFVGSGHLRDEIRKISIRLSISEKIIFLGERSDIPDLLNMSDVFVLPSLWEGMPNSVLEAMASGTAVIATGVDGTRELIDSGVDGILVPPADIDSLCSAILKIGSDESIRNEYSSSAMKKVREQYTNQTTIDRYLELYNRELEN